jgi:GntR family transcriptional regulator / MocR family aminotransferase
MDEGLLARHIRKAGREYAARHDLIVSRLAADFGEWLTVVPSAAGLHVAARARPGIDVDAVVERAARLDVAVESLARYCAARPQRGLVIGYGLASQSHIPEGLTRLLKAFRSP